MNKLDVLWQQMGDTFGELTFGLSNMISAIQDEAFAEGQLKGALEEDKKLLKERVAKVLILREEIYGWEETIAFIENGYYLILPINSLDKEAPNGKDRI